MPALVVHGRRDPFFPVGNGEALAREIPGARLLVLERAATAIPDALAGEVAAAMLAL
jgi:pimeloyl-ACP methyl ester carboxylesterase